MKRFAHGLVVGLLSLAAVTTIAVLAISMPLTNRETVKSWPVQAGTYQAITPQLIAMGGQEDDGPLNALLSSPAVDQSALRGGLEGLYPAQHWQTQAQTVIDSVYDWLEGKSPAPEFAVNLASNAENLVGQAEEQLEQAMMSLPVCTQPVQANNPIEAGCRPPGVPADELVEQLTGEIASADAAAVDGGDLNLSAEALELGPKAFRWARNAVWIGVALLLVLSALAVVTAKTPLHGLRRVGQTLFVAGLLSWIGFYLAKRGIGSAETVFKPAAEDPAQQELVAAVWVPLMREIFTSLANFGLWVALTVVLTGGIVWLAAFIWHKIHHEDQPVQPRHKSQNDHVLPPPVKN